MEIESAGQTQYDAVGLGIHPRRGHCRLDTGAGHLYRLYWRGGDDLIAARWPAITALTAGIKMR